MSADDADVPGFSFFTRKSGSIRHFWSGEMLAETADPGQDPRGAPDLMSLWTILDSTPEGPGHHARAGLLVYDIRRRSHRRIAVRP